MEHVDVHKTYVLTRPPTKVGYHILNVENSGKVESVVTVVTRFW